MAILKLVTECVSSQPGMMELFLSIQPAPPDSAKKPTKNKVCCIAMGTKESGWSLFAVCFNHRLSIFWAKRVVFILSWISSNLKNQYDRNYFTQKILNCVFPCSLSQTPPPLMQSALLLLRNLWVGRHDAALIALRAQKDFWKHLTHPLFQDLQQSENNVSIL